MENKISYELQSETLKAIRFPLAVMVVFIHSFSMGDYDQPNWTHLSGMDINVAKRILFSHVITHIAVPTFYLISGYFFFYKVTNFDFATYKGKLRKRIHTLLIPYILWNTLPILMVVIRKVAAFFVKGKPLSNILEFFQENQGIRLFWDCNVLGLNYTNWLGYSTPKCTDTDSVVFFEGFDNCCYSDTSHFLFS